MNRTAKLLILFLFLVSAGGGFAAWSERESDRALIEELEQKSAALAQEASTLKQKAAACEESKQQATAELQKVQQANCKGTWSVENGCEEPQKVFITPAGGETFCFGKTVEVKWDATLVKADTVEVYLGTSSNSGKLATVPNDGIYRWNLETTHKPIGGGGGFTIAPGLYGLRMQSPEGETLGKDSELFTIKKCGAGSAKPAPKQPAKKTATKSKAQTRKKH
jgi:hypothetical protein